ncbi:hypothetical protein Poli38472_013759 [Pythium oligandrum]|uniref:Uncharacterized protein n=1 Tax=Pythium oligandrum TaxID=41045 RepID=A0A8K1CDB2_PYTOL|nr:hypothetical protein Poli38472_013759 [Pythium oligandrum]|eukprot:TMW61296.1 hypothetical protein Poli38472_013759 [Pythium oligandrum]
MGESDHGEWEEWEGDDAAPTLLHSSEAPSMEAPGKGDVEKPKSDPLSWTWDLSAMEEDLVSLTPVREGSALISSEATPDEEKLGSLVSAGPWVMQRVNETRSQVESTRALALVTKWHVLRMRQSLSPGNDDKTLGAIDVELSAISGEWGTDTNDFEAEHEQLREVTTLLHHSLAACEDAMEPFQQAFEQLFASFPEQSLCISSTWIRPTNGQSDTLTSSTSASFDAYLRRVVALCDTDLHSLFRVSQLTEAEAFQDAKDIQRDELVVNSEEVVGAIGYDEIVNRIQAHIRSQISSHLGSIDEDNYDKTRVVAQQILNACNRTESGGTSYETLSQFVSNHTMDHVLIRPASEKAPPLRIDMDVGPFRDEAHGDGWCFGLRVKVSAITWYWICDAADPTIEYYQIQTTYANRLAFGLGLTAFSSSSLMRRDVATVMITLMNTSSDELMGTQLLYEAEEAADAAEDGEVDFDALM